MADKTANVTARLSPEVKQQAEAILRQLGVPVSVLIDSLYRQIIMTNGIPYRLEIPTPTVREEMSFAQFDAMLKTSLKQAKSGQGPELDEAFQKLEAGV